MPIKSWRKVGMTSSLHGPYELGYTRATMIITMRGNNVQIRANLQKLS